MIEKQYKTILVIDDDPDTGKLISYALETTDVRVIPASEPATSVEKAKETVPDLIFISLVLSGSNGLKICRAIHSVESLKKTPVILLASRPGEIDLIHVEFIGVVDIMIKPLNPDILVSRIKKILGEDTVSSVSNKQLLRSFVEEELGRLPFKEDPVDIKKAQGKTKSLGDELLDRPEGGEIEPEAEHAAEDAGGFNEMNRRALKERSKPFEALEDEITGSAEFSDEAADSDRVKDSRSVLEKGKYLAEKIPVSYIVTVFLIFGVGAFLFTDTGKKLLRMISTTDTVKKEPLKKETAPEVISMDDERTGKALSPGSADESKELTASVQNTGDQEPVLREPSSPQKQRTFKKKIYSIHVGVFEEEKNALLFAEQLRKKGYDAFVRKELNNKKNTIYRVLIGRFDKRSITMGKTKIILQKEGLESFVYTIEPDH